MMVMLLPSPRNMSPPCWTPRRRLIDNVLDTAIQRHRHVRCERNIELLMDNKCSIDFVHPLGEALRVIADQLLLSAFRWRSPQRRIRTVVKCGIHKGQGIADELHREVPPSCHLFDKFKRCTERREAVVAVVALGQSAAQPGLNILKRACSECCVRALHVVCCQVQKLDAPGGRGCEILVVGGRYERGQRLGVVQSHMH